MNDVLKKQLYTAICLNNFNFSEAERNALYQKVVDLTENQAQRIAELEATVARQTQGLADNSKIITQLEKDIFSYKKALDLALNR